MHVFGYDVAKISMHVFSFLLVEGLIIPQKAALSQAVGKN